MQIKKVVVIGSGTMGSGIAAQLCNANIPVTLLDLKTEISEKAKERILKSRPPLLIDKLKINNIKVGNINDDFNMVKDADWVVEAVVERIDIKHNIYEKIFKERKAGTIVSSNTSSIPIKVLSEKLSNEEKGIEFGAPRNSLIFSIKNNIFDDILIGNFMKTKLINVPSLYPDFTPYVTKYGDNGMARSDEELKKYFDYYKLNSTNYWLDYLKIKSEDIIRPRIEKYKSLYFLARSIKRTFA